MRVTLKVGASFALLWIAAKMITYFLGMGIDWYNTSALLNNFLLLSAIAFGLYLHKRKQGFVSSSFLDDVKEAATSGLIYTMLVAGFSYFYLAKIDSSYLDYRIDERMTMVEQELSEPDKMKEYRISYPEAELKSDAQILLDIRQTTEGVLNPGVQFIMLLMGFLVLSFLYALLVAVFVRKILLRGLTNT